MRQNLTLMVWVAGAAFVLGACSGNAPKTANSGASAGGAPHAVASPAEDDSPRNAKPATSAGDASHAATASRPRLEAPTPAPQPDPEPPTPSLFRSLGRALGKGVSDAITEPRSAETAPPTEAAPSDAPPP